MSSLDDGDPDKPSSTPRGAAHIIAGFRYQILQSVSALMSLRTNEELLLEISEDYTIIAPEGTTDYQVKNSQAIKGPRAFSIQSAETQAALERFWEASSNGKLDRRLVFLARGGATVERGHDFPHSTPGLIYWHQAALDADTAPLRTLLSRLFKGKSLGHWIDAGPSDRELRERLLRRVQWQLNSLSSNQLEIQLRDQLVEYLNARNLPVSAASQGVKALTALIFEAAAKPNPEDRRVTSLNLDRVVEEVSGVQLVAQRLIGSEPPSVADQERLLVSEIGSVATTVVRRSEIVSGLVERIRGEPLVWIHGSNAVGKSTLARLIGQRLGGQWLELDLRPVQKDAAGSLAAWRELVRAMSSALSLEGVIIDDFDQEAEKALRSRLSALSQVLSARGGRILITSHHSPSPALLQDCGSTANAAIQAPYFNEADVAELVSASPAPPGDTIPAWTLFIRVATGGGHPLLSAAKVSSLRARGWPQNALVEDLGGTPSEAIRLSRDEGRRALLDDLSKLDQARSLDAGSLLRRIGCVFDRVDDDLVRHLYLSEPALKSGGDALAVLRGTWLELMPDGCLRISPLLTDITSDVPFGEARRMRRLAAEYWLNKRVLDARTLPLCFWNAFLGDHQGVLMALFQLLYDLPRERLRGAAALLSPIIALDTNKPLSTNPAVAANLRLLQFEVAEVLEDAPRAGLIARRLMDEAHSVDHADIRDLLLHIALSKILMGESVEISPAERIAYALTLRRVEPRSLELLKGRDADRASYDHQFGPDVDTADILFASIVKHIRRSEDAIETFSALGKIDPQDRDGFIDAMSEIYEGHSVFVHSGWTADQFNDRDMNDALRAYDRIEEIVKGWGRTDLSRNVACARSVILDEGLKRFDDAIDVIDRAVSSYGIDALLIRQKSKVLGHAGRDSEAIELLLGIEDEVGRESPFDRSLALRDGAISAARSGRFSDAARLFKKAQATLGSVPDKEPLIAGLIIEMALALWRDGKKPDAILAAAKALEAVSHFDVNLSRQAERSHQYARALVGLFHRDLDSPDTNPPFSFGNASTLELEKAKLQDAALQPLARYWRILAAVELGLGCDVGIDARSVQLQGEFVSAPVEVLICRMRYERSVAEGALSKAVQDGVRLARTLRGLKCAKEKNEEQMLIKASSLDFPDARDIFEDEGAELVLWVVLDLVEGEVAVAERRLSQQFVSDLREACKKELGDFAALGSLLDLLSGRDRRGDLSPTLVAYATALAVPADTIEGSPDARFYCDVLSVVRLSTSLAKGVLAGPVSANIHAGWRKVLERQTFRLKNPAPHVSGINEALGSSPSLGSAAKILLAAEPTINHIFESGWTEALSRIAKNK